MKLPFLGYICGALGFALLLHLWIETGYSGSLSFSWDALGWDLFLLAFYFGLHSLLASQRMKDAMGLNATAHRKFYLLATLVATLGVDLGWAHVGGPHLWHASGALAIVFHFFQLFGFLGFLWTAKSFDRREFFGEKTSHSTALVYGGPFALCRHPSYFFLLFMLLTPQMTTDRALIAFATIIYILVGSKLEEQKLSRLYGEQYRAYQQQTPWLIPNLKSVSRAYSKGHP